MIICAVRIARTDARMFLKRGSTAFLHKDFAVQKFYTHLKEPSSEFRVFRGWASRDDSYDCCFEIAGIAFRSPWRHILPGEATQMLAPAEDEPLSMQNWGCERCGNKPRLVVAHSISPVRSLPGPQVAAVWIPTRSDQVEVGCLHVFYGSQPLSFVDRLQFRRDVCRQCKARRSNPFNKHIVRLWSSVMTDIH